MKEDEIKAELSAAFDKAVDFMGEKEVGKMLLNKMQHKNAEILRAIADGETVEWLNPAGEWVTLKYLTIGTDDSLGYTDLKWRIKPKAIIINGIECEAPVPFDKAEYRIHINIPGLSNRFCANFASENAALTAFNALIKPFNKTLKKETK